LKFNQTKLTIQSQNSNAIGFKTLTWFCDWNWLRMAWNDWNSHLRNPKTQQWSFGNSYVCYVHITEGNGN